MMADKVKVLPTPPEKPLPVDKPVISNIGKIQIFKSQSDLRKEQYAKIKEEKRQLKLQEISYVHEVVIEPGSNQIEVDFKRTFMVPVKFKYTVQSTDGKGEFTDCACAPKCPCEGTNIFITNKLNEKRTFIIDFTVKPRN